MTESAASTATTRSGPVRRLYNWIMRNAEGRHAWALLAGVAFAEASFFPILPDIVMAPMILADRKRAFAIAAWCTLWSVVGGILGYTIGSVFYDTVGRWLISLYGEGGQVDSFRVMFAHNAWLILALGLVTPFKLVTISSGFAGVPFPLFMLYSAITRTIRFTVVGSLLYVFGAPVRNFLEKWLEHALIGVFVLLVVVLLVLRVAFHHFA